MNRRNPQALIAALMMEDSMDAGTGMGSPTRETFGPPVNDVDMDNFETAEEEIPDGFTADELRIAKRFVELMGTADRAREAVEKVDECSDCLDLVDDASESMDDHDQIAHMASMMPVTPDLPTKLTNTMGMSSLYNPSAMGAPTL
jgi:hypothetical protein